MCIIIRIPIWKSVLIHQRSLCWFPIYSLNIVTIMEIEEQSTEQEYHPMDLEQQNPVALEHNAMDLEQRKPKREHNPTQQNRLPSLHAREDGKWKTLILAYQTLGVVFGSVGTSPLYAYASTPIKNPSTETYLGIFSLIFWTLTLISVKYLCIALYADDHGEGGIFAVYSLLCERANICRHSVKLLASDTERNSSYLKLVLSSPLRLLDTDVLARKVLFFLAMLGTCMLMGDGILTPAISVLSAVGGLQTSVPSLSNYTIVALSAVILILLFLVQRFGTSGVSSLFSLVMVVWFIANAMIGLYNIVVYYGSVFKSISPSYIVHFFARNGKDGWLMLNGVVNCITGAEAMFADLGHFNRISIRLAYLTTVYPSLVLTYAGQTAYLIKNPHDYTDAFYKSLPKAVYWPMFVMATLAAIVASQGLISATFSITKQLMTSDYFPRLKLLHTSTYKEGQIYCPEINYILMVLCVGVIVGFQTSTHLSNSYGVVVIMVMLITTTLLTVVMGMIWKIHLVLILLFFCLFVTIEGGYVSAVLTKVPQGGWLPFAFSLILFMIILGWYTGREKKFEYEMSNKINVEGLHLFTKDIQRVPGICFFYSKLIHGIPPVVGHYLKTVRSLHEVVVLTTFKYLPVKTVLPEDRFLVKALGFTGFYRCIIQYGYNDTLNVEGEEFTYEILNALQNYIKYQVSENMELLNPSSNPSTVFPPSSVEQSLNNLANARTAGVVHVVAKSRLYIGKGINWFERILLQTVYVFLHNNCRSSIAVYNVPASSTVEIGMIYKL